jgi:hypothetical protein
MIENSTKKRKTDNVNQETQNKIILLYPITRYYQNVFAQVEYDQLPIKKQKIMKFYKRVISEKDRQIIFDAYQNDSSQDLNGDIAINIVDENGELSKDSKLKYKDLMCGLIFYEGLKKKSDNVYEVLLGS